MFSYALEEVVGMELRWRGSKLVRERPTLSYYYATVTCIRRGESLFAPRPVVADADVATVVVIAIEFICFLLKAPRRFVDNKPAKKFAWRET